LKSIKANKFQHQQIQVAADISMHSKLYSVSKQLMVGSGGGVVKLGNDQAASSNERFTLKPWHLAILIGVPSASILSYILYRKYFSSGPGSAGAGKIVDEDSRSEKEKTKSKKSTAANASESNKSANSKSKPKQPKV
jgi:hypothetical protein